MTVTVEFAKYPEGSKQPVFRKADHGPRGSQARGIARVLGSWRTAALDAVSDNGLTITFKASADGLMMSWPTGESYRAKFDGKQYPIKGDPGGSLVSLKKLDERPIDETVKRDDRIDEVNHLTVSADSGTLHVKSEDKVRRTTTTWIAAKQ